MQKKMKRDKHSQKVGLAACFREAAEHKNGPKEKSYEKTKKRADIGVEARQSSKRGSTVTKKAME